MNNLNTYYFIAHLWLFKYINSLSQFVFHLDWPGVGEAVGQIPEIAHVIEEPDLVDFLHFFPHESKDPKDDDAFDWRWEGAAFFGVPVVDKMG